MEMVDIRLEVRERVGELTADFWTDVEVDRAINDAVRRFASEEQWPFLLTEWESEMEEDTDGSAVETLELPSNISLTRTFNLAVSDGGLARPRLVERVDAKEGFVLRHQFQDAPGVPRFYYITFSNQSDDESPPVVYTVRFVPPPDAIYTVQALYFATPVLLSGASDEPMVPEEYQECIPAWAAGKLFLKEQSVSQKASEQFQLYQMVLSQARKDLKAFSLDEVVALGRREPMRGRGGMGDPRYRIAPTLGG